jgi:hypothetical protein
MRNGFFPADNYPASALIAVSNFERSGMVIEIQGVAVIGSSAFPPATAPNADTVQRPRPRMISRA